MMTLREYLKAQGETQAAFAERVGMTQGNVAKLCGDSPKLRPKTAVCIERATGGLVPVEAWPQYSVLSSREINAQNRYPSVNAPEGFVACNSDKRSDRKAALQARQTGNTDTSGGAA